MRFQLGDQVISRIPGSRLPFVATVIGLDEKNGFVGIKLFLGKINDQDEYWIHQDFIRKHKLK